jgi:hypothetical protein
MEESALASVKKTKVNKELHSPPQRHTVATTTKSVLKKWVFLLWVIL